MMVELLGGWAIDPDVSSTTRMFGLTICAVTMRSGSSLAPASGAGKRMPATSAPKASVRGIARVRREIRIPLRIARLPTS
jgi:hypothetical protein